MILALPGYQAVTLCSRLGRALLWHDDIPGSACRGYAAGSSDVNCFQVDGGFGKVTDVRKKELAAVQLPSKRAVAIYWRVH